MYRDKSIENRVSSEELIIAASQSLKEKEYWLNKFSGEVIRSCFPTDYPSTGLNENSIKVVNFNFTGSMFSRLMKLSNGSDPRLHMILTAAAAVLLDKYTGNKDIIIGTTIDRQDTNQEFINTILPLRMQLEAPMTYKELLLQVRQTILKAVENQNYPMEALLNHLGIPVDENEFPLFDVAVLLENIHDKQYIKHIKSNVVFSFLRKEECIEGTLQFNSSLYDGETIKQIITHFKHLLQQVIFNVGVRLSRVEVMSEANIKQLLRDFNSTGVDYPREKTIYELFENRVKEVPDRIAAGCEDKQITYKELNKKANQLARLIREKGVKPDTIAGIMVDRSLEMLTGILAILKAGGVYLPIDPGSSKSRIEFMLEDCGVNQLLTTTDLEHKIQFKGKAILLDKKEIYRGNHTNLRKTSTAANVAYIIYTSGTTGKPKGVLVNHQALVNYIWWAANTYVKNEPVDFPLYTSISFDLTVTSIFTPLITGNAVFVYGGGHNELLIQKIVKENKVGVIKLTPSHLKLIKDKHYYSKSPGGEVTSSIKRFIVGGEQLDTSLARDISHSFNGNIEIYNEYGPTETVVGCMIYKFDEGKDNRKSVPIGIPIANTEIYLLDRNLNPVPFSAAGEIYIAGDGVAGGYLNRLELTAEKFKRAVISHSSLVISSSSKLFPNDQCPMTNDRSYLPYLPIYRTGDLARWLPDGNIEFFGRQDNQVKIRGFRIELGEIENKLLIHHAVKDVVVIVQDDDNGNKYLTAYCVFDQPLTEAEIREFLSADLPDYMIPSYFMEIEKIPLTANGKVDKKKLPAPQLKKDETYVAPQGRVEKRLAEIWSEVLGVKKDIISTTKSFFELGGHSLSATILLSKIHKEFNVRMTLLDMFRKSTIKDLSKYFEQAPEVRYAAIEPSEKKDFYVLSSAQKRLFILQQMEVDNIAYNVPEIIELSGKPNEEKLAETTRKLIKRHESLRTSITWVDGEPVQRVHEDATFSIEYLDLIENNKPGKLSLEKAVENFVKPFDLSQAPLFRVEVVRTGEQTFVLIVDKHHIISDSASEEIIERDFAALYSGQELPALKLHYKDYSQWQHTQMQIEIIKQQEAFWKAEFEGDIPRLNLPTDHKRPDIRSFEGTSLSFLIDGKETAALKELAKREGVTHFMLLLAIFDVLLWRLSSQEDIVVGTPIAGRRHADLEQIIGIFINTLALRNFPNGEKNFADFLNEIKEKTLKVFENQEYQFEDLVDQVVVVRDTSRNPLFDVMFTLQESDTNRVKISEEEQMDLARGYLEYESTASKFDWTLIVSVGDHIHCFFKYCTRLFKPETMERFARYFKAIVETVVEKPGIKLSQLEILSHQEKVQILDIFNDTGTGYPRDKTIHELFEEQVERTPHSTAVVYEENKLTYHELNARVNRLAYQLRTMNVTANSIVGLMVERSIEMITGIFGILKAGGAYLPIDPKTPLKRIFSMLKQANAQILLTTNSQLKNHSFTNLRFFHLSPGTPCVTVFRPQMTDFSSFPDRSLVDYEKYNQNIGQAMVKNSVSLQATRGCPYNCAYCHKIWPKKHVLRSAENIFQEVLTYYKMGVRRFAFVDDIFNLNVGNSKRFFELILENELDLQLFFPNGMRGDILSKDYIDLMVKAGTVNLALALETASPRLQTLIRKNLNLEKLRENIQYFCETYPQVILELFTMHGFPTETEEEAWMTLDFIKRLKWVHFPYVFVLKMYPDTDMAKLGIEQGVSPEAVALSENLAFHELPDTLPFDKSVTLKYQARFLDEYFLLKERLLHVLPYQMRTLTEDELVQKYDSYLPVDIKSTADLLQFVGISVEELKTGAACDEHSMVVPNLNEKIKNHFPVTEPGKDALKVLLLDLSQYFSGERHMLYDVVDPPLGLMYIMTHLTRRLGSKIKGKIAKSRIDFDNYSQLKKLLKEFKPDVIGIRSLTFFKDFFHKTISIIRQWGVNAPLIAGGPYATSSYQTLLQDKNIDLAVIGEGELTFQEIIEKMIENKGKLPGEKELKKIPGVAFIPREESLNRKLDWEILLLDEFTNVFDRTSDDKVTNINKNSDLAYTIFTSGSTGIPKGIMIEHRNVNNLVLGLEKRIYRKYPPALNVAMLSPYVFDASVKQIFGALLLGHVLYIVPEDMRIDGPGLHVFYKRNRIDVSDGTPAHLHLMLESIREGMSWDFNVKLFLIGGEALPPKLVLQFLDRFKNHSPVITNVYGPSECCDLATCYEISPGDMKSVDNIPIGRALPNIQVYITDAQGHLQPIGVAGELCIGGDGVGRGYLGDEILTLEKFTENPFKKENEVSTSLSNQMYRTGDRARWLRDGNIEFLGRIDNQIKIRGFRVELGEIENHLLKHEEIKETVVLAFAHENGDKYLCAYIVHGRKPAISELREYLFKTLPDYMIPSYFVFLDKIPLTSNGKIDRRALPGPQLKAGKEHLVPRNTIEKKLAELWAEVLGVEKDIIGIDSNFFELGGHSLRATVMTAKIHKELNVKVPLAEIFKTPTIRRLAEYISITNQEQFTPIQPVEKRDYYVLSSAQKRLYILQQIRPQNIAYNMPDIIYLSSAPDVEILERTFLELIERHESLRTSFVKVEDQPIQRVYNMGDVVFQIEYNANLQSSDSPEVLVERFTRPFDLSQAPLLRVGVIQIEESNYLLVDIHHIISDGVSQGVLVKDFMALYQGEKLPPLRIQYKDYSKWQNDEKEREAIKRQEEYWLKEFEGEIPLLNLPTDYPRPHVQGFEGNVIHFIIGEEETKKMKECASEEEVTLYMVLLSIYTVLLSKVTGGQEDIVVGTGAAGRRHADLQKVIGMFVNTLAMRNYPKREKIFKEFLKEVKNRTLEAFENQDYQFEDLVEKVVQTRDWSRNPLVEAVLVLQNLEEDSGEIPEVEIPEIKQEPIKRKNRIAKFDITLFCAQVGRRLSVSIEYSTALFKKETIEMFVGYFKEIVSVVIENREIRLKDIKISSELAAITPGIIHEEQGDFGF